MATHSKIFLPKGTIGITFTGAPPAVSRIRSNSPIASRVRLGQVVVQLCIPGEIEAHGLTSKELCEFLKEYDQVEGRFIVVANEESKSPQQPTPSAPPAPRYTNRTTETTRVTW